jgi:hypothetical protein
MTRLIITTLIFLATVTVGCSSSGCSGNAGIITRQAAGDFYDCLKPEAVKVGTELAGVMDKAVRSAINNDGTFDRQQLKDAAAPIKEPAMRCAFATAIATVGRIISGPNAVQSSPLEVAEAERAAALREVAGLYGVAGFKLEAP